MKRCSMCGEWKQLIEFPKDRTKKDGRRASCSLCKNTRDRSQYAANPKKQLEEYRVWCLNNRDWVQNYRENHSSQTRARVKKWYADHPEKRSAKNRNRHFKTRGGTGKITSEEWQSVLDKYGNKCLYPGCDRTDVTMDHILPLAKGGKHSIDNVQPLCFYHNSSKNDKYIDYRNEIS